MRGPAPAMPPPPMTAGKSFERAHDRGEGAVIVGRAHGGSRRTLARNVETLTVQRPEAVDGLALVGDDPDVGAPAPQIARSSARTGQIHVLIFVHQDVFEARLTCFWTSRIVLQQASTASRIKIAKIDRVGSFKLVFVDLGRFRRPRCAFSALSRSPRSLRQPVRLPPRRDTAPGEMSSSLQREIARRTLNKFDSRVIEILIVVQAGAFPDSLQAERANRLGRGRGHWRPAEG